MPDWFYRTVAQPCLFRLPDRAARALALGVIGTLGKTRPGRGIISFLGHMEADPLLGVRVAGMDLQSPIGIGWRVDPELRATQGLSQFGVGCVEVAAEGRRDVTRSSTEELQEGLPTSGRPAVGGITVPLLRRTIPPDGREMLLFPDGTVAPVVAWNESPEAFQGIQRGIVLQVGSRQSDGGWNVPTLMPPDLPERVRAWRSRLGPGSPLVVAGGVAEPQDARALVRAGADIVLIDAGLVFRGPGLVKRCNQALLLDKAVTPAPTADSAIFRQSWPWACAIGVALMTGGAAALLLAATRVLLPYDEHYLGITSRALAEESPRLFAFMAHDRGTLAGTMLGLGWLYTMLGWHGVRRGIHGARSALVASALSGFASFFSFFGFGYFDTLHAFVAVVLFQLTVQVMVGRSDGPAVSAGAMEREDASWRLAQWAQLLWIVHAVGLLIAGIVILGIGMTDVFVREDLGFLSLTELQIQGLGERMIAVVAHDRATLGGMLLSSGTAMLLSVLWCFRKGAAWLWRAIAGLGAAAYAAAIGMHLAVGYTDLHHLVPAFAGLALWAAGLALSFAYLRKQ